MIPVLKSKIDPIRAFLFQTIPSGKDESDLKERYRRLCHQNNKNFFNSLTDHLQPSAQDQNIGMWFKYAISCNQRGKAAAKLIEKHRKIKNSACLDVGCAYGGLLVAFTKGGASRVVGLDIDPTLIKLAKQNFKDQHINPEVFVRSVTESEVNRELFDSFDIITCNDVIEHVDSPRAAVNNMSRMLKKGGTLYLEIPNKYYPEFVLSDGHYSMFGITLLDINEAEEYYHMLYPDTPYTVGHYLLIEEYKALFEEAGMEFKIMEESFAGYDKQRILDAVENIEQNDSLIDRVPEKIRGLVSSQIRDYTAEVSKWADSDDEFKVRFGTSFWKIIGTKVNQED